jgi:hypothetical protein
LYFHPIFLVIISLNKGKFGILINIKYYLKNKNGWRVQCTRQHPFGLHMRGQATSKRWLLGQRSNRFGCPSIPRRHVWLMDLWFCVDDIFFLLSLSSLIFAFYFLNFQRSLSVCFSFKFDPFSFYYYFFIWNNL